jgi:putative spermidine/putrescine transport system substrate-binding protein
MERRAFLGGALILALAQLTAGCSNRDQVSLKVRLLKNSIPPQLIGEFRQNLQQAANLKFEPENQLEELFNYLIALKRQGNKQETQQQWRLPLIGGSTPAIPDLVTLGDYWLEKAIELQLIQPLAINELKNWQQLPKRWQELVERDSQQKDNKNKVIWGAPYRWGSTVIIYDRDKFNKLGWEPQDWSDLWRPQLRDRISLLDQPREVIGLTLKKLGLSYNTSDLDKVPQLKEELRRLHRQVKFYSSDNYLQPLILGDIWVAVGWSTDVIPLQASQPQLTAVVPKSGTALWADLWVKPTSVNKDEKLSLVNDWIDFCWKKETARDITLFSKGASPILTGIKNSLLLPDAAVFDKSEFLKPLPKSALQQYQSLWKEIRLLKAQ